MQNEYYPFINLPLPYDYDALEPFIDAKTMHLHHDKHLQTYIDNLNALLKNYPKLQSLSLENLIKHANTLPTDIQKPLRNHAGGVFNHRFFFDLLANPSEDFPTGPLMVKIIQSFGSFDAFKEAFTHAALSVFGSGYAWLVLSNEHLSIITTTNQNTPLELNMCPILTIDVWEHAYYLKHYNQRKNYIENWFKVINWTQAKKLYLSCLS